MADDTNSSMCEILEQPISLAAVFYESEAYKQLQEQRKNEITKYNTLINLGNEIIKALNFSRR